MEKVEQKKERRKPVWILFFKEAIFPQGTHSDGCVFNKPRLFLRDFSKDANLSETDRGLFMRSSFPSYATQV